MVEPRTPAAKAARFYKNKGRRVSPDEQTQNFSDDENSEDGLEKRHLNKEITGVVTVHLGYLKKLAHKFLGVVPNQEVIIDGDRVGFVVKGLSRLDAAAIQQVRSMDRVGEASLYNMSRLGRGANGLDQTEQQTVISINLERFLNAWLIAKQYRRFFILGIVSLLIFLYIVTSILGSIRAYL